MILMQDVYLNFCIIVHFFYWFIQFNIFVIKQLLDVMGEARIEWHIYFPFVIAIQCHKLYQNIKKFRILMDF